METTEVRSKESTRPGRTANLVRILNEDGMVDGTLSLSEFEIEALFRAVAATHAFEEQFDNLREEDRVPFVPRSDREVSATVAAVAALASDDWVFPTSKDLGALVYRAVPFEHIFHHVLGNEADPTRGHQQPGHFTAREQRIASVSAATAGHLTHATGVAWAAATRKDATVALAFFSAASADAAEFHTGLNFAGVLRAPVVFVCKNFSTEDIARRAVAYGIGSVRVDGDDPFAVHAVVREAREKASAGGGPTLVDVVFEGEPVGGAERIERYLRRMGDGPEILRESAQARVAAALDEARNTDAPDRDTLFTDVFAAVPAHLDEQRRQGR